MDLLTKTILSMAPKEEEIIVTGKANLFVYSLCTNVIFNYAIILLVQLFVQVFPSSWIELFLLKRLTWPVCFRFFVAQCKGIGGCQFATSDAIALFVACQGTKRERARRCCV